jgi:TPR repeat protein
MYESGKGVSQDYKQAVKWYRLAAGQGHAGAQNNLGVMYLKGLGVLRNDVLGYMWATIADYNGHSSAKKLQQHMANVMNSNQIAEAQKLAQQCLDSNYTNCGE